MPDTMMPVEAPSLGKLAGALAEAQKNFAPIPKDREVTVRSERGNYTFKYATLDAIRAATMPALAAQGLAVVQGMIEHGNGYAVETKLLHSSGEWIRNVTPMFVSGRVKDGRTYPPTNQELGSAQSYARRYGLSALICITADEDDDGNTADGNHIEKSERVPYKGRNPGSASAGTDFRPPGPRRMPTSNWVGDATADGIVDTTREKGTLPAKSGRAPTDAVELAKWCKESVGAFGEIQTKADLVAWWKANADRRGEAETKMPAEFERVIVAYDARMDTVSAKGV